MPEHPAPHKDPWLTSPLRAGAGSLLLAGSLEDTPGINPDSMRILGSYALIFMLSGEGYYADANGVSRGLAAGDAALVFPDLPHAYGPGADGKWQQLYVVFDGPCFDLLRQSGILAPQRPVWHAEPVDYWRRRIESIFRPAARKGGVALRALGSFLSLLTDLAATDHEASQSDELAWVDDATRLLSEPRRGEWLTPQQVAPRVGLSYENFRKLFAANVGESPGQFQKRRRIEHACAAIYQNTASLKQLAESLGFCDVYHFSRVFSQVMGESPSSYRRRVRGS